MSMFHNMNVVMNGYYLGVDRKDVHDGLVYMNNLERYRLNFFSQLAEGVVRVTWDGDEASTVNLKINQGKVLSIDTIPGNARNGKLTFIAKNSREFFDAELDKVDELNLGLIRALFIPKKQKFDQDLEAYSPRPGEKNLRSGGTGLSGISNQPFEKTSIGELDYNNCTELFIRLVQYPQIYPKSQNLKIVASSKIPPIA
jgi:hypothetical protein